MINVLVITNSDVQSKALTKSNTSFVPGIYRHLKNLIEGRNITIKFVTANSILHSDGVCGQQCDVILNLSDVDTQELKDAVIPCLLWK